MMNAYSNTGVPPRSKVQITVKPIGRQIVFDLAYAGVGVAYNGKKTDQQREADVRSWFEDFVRRHKAELDAVLRPTGFMLGSICEDINAPLDDLMRRYPGVYQVCTDPILTVAILGRVSGLIYVPRRELRLTEDSFFDTIGFPAKYFPQYCGGRGATALPGDGRARTPCAPKGGDQ